MGEKRYAYEILVEKPERKWPSGRHGHRVEDNFKMPGLVMWDLWWTKSRWRRFSPSTSVSPANIHSTNCSTITIIYHLGLVQ
jgi:hypothetical protein